MERTHQAQGALKLHSNGPLRANQKRSTEKDVNVYIYIAAAAVAVVVVVVSVVDIVHPYIHIFKHV